LTHKDRYQQLVYAAAVARNPTADIALVKLISDVKLTNAVKPAFLPRYSERNEQFANRMATISGFGMDQSGSPSPVMKFTDVKIITNGACIPYFGNVGSNVMCAKSTVSKASSCQGDSGSPLVLKDVVPVVVVGVASYEHAAGCDKGEMKGWKRISTDPLTISGYPVGYVRTAQQLDWILTYSGIPRRS
jgi:secreted trypsin-like serine protease